MTFLGAAWQMCTRSRPSSQKLCQCTMMPSRSACRALALSTCLWLKHITSKNPAPGAPFSPLSGILGLYSVVCMWVCSIGVVHCNMGENEKALEYFNKSVNIKIKVYGQDHPLVADTKVGQLLNPYSFGWGLSVFFCRATLALSWSRCGARFSNPWKPLLLDIPNRRCQSRPPMQK